MPTYATESLESLIAGFASGERTPSDYIETLQDRHSTIEPQVQAWMREDARFDRARAEVQNLAERFPADGDRPPLFGLPVGVKDIFKVSGLPTTAGSKLPTSLFEGEASEAVSALHAAGALILGKTVSTEFAYFGPGPTHNPLDFSRTPGGSSSGSAAAVAAGLVPLALGTQTIGSISRPAAYCGVVGYKPSYDRISRAGVVPLAPSLDHIGTFTSDVSGAMLAASVLCSDWSPDAEGGLPTLAIPKGPILKRASTESLHHLKATADRLKAAGFPVKVVPAIEDFDAIEKRHRDLVAAEAAVVHGNWYADYGALYHPKTIALLAAGKEVSAEEVEAARAGRKQLRAELTSLMADNRIDLWITPAAQDVAPVGLDSTGDPIMNLVWSHCGLPTLSIPVGKGDEGMPLGLQVAAGWNQDERLLSWGQAIEKALADG